MEKGAVEGEHESLRRCIVSQESAPKDAMIRFVVGPDRSIVPDLAAALPGKGIWVTARRSVLQEAVRRQLFSRAAREKIAVADGLATQVEVLLRKRVAQALGMCRRSGVALCGFEKVKALLVAGEARALVQAADASEDGRQRLRRLAGECTAVVECLDRRELAVVMGREDVVHVALKAQGATDRFLVEAQRLTGFKE